ncbi:Protein of unknown function [Gryllus bimaculatus]|nr:Protein of unknown function [Gryllus bimaculatus]
MRTCAAAPQALVLRTRRAACQWSLRREGHRAGNRQLARLAAGFASFQAEAMSLPWALRLLLPLAALLAALLQAAHAQVVEANAGAGGGAVYVSNGGGGGDKYYGQWSIGDMTCYIARDRVNGVLKVVKQCRNGFLGAYHDMTPEEEAMIDSEIKRLEEQKRIMQEKIAESNAILQSTMRSMNNQIQRSMQGFNNYMHEMQQMMQQQFQNAFESFLSGTLLSRIIPSLKIKGTVKILSGVHPYSGIHPYVNTL